MSYLGFQKLLLRGAYGKTTAGRAEVKAGSRRPTRYPRGGTNLIT